MKHLKLLFPALLCVLCLTSCMSEEPLNQECDIECVTLGGNRLTELFYNVSQATYNVPSSSDSVRFEIKADAVAGEVPVSLTVTPGATVIHNNTSKPFVNGTALNFSNGRRHYFTVISEDGNWSRLYYIFLDNELPIDGNMSFTFEDYELEGDTPNGKYYEWKADGNAMRFFTDGIWKNGNPGFKLSRSSAKPTEYPSTPQPGLGPDGSSCVKLETMSTGPFGNMVNMRLASGSFFNGVFEVKDALKDALKATRFGSPFKHKPLKITAWIKYTPGPTFQDRKGNTVEGVTDEPDMYCILYRNTDEKGNYCVLDGYDVVSSPRIVGMARLPHHYNADGSDKLSDNPIHGIGSTWQKVELPVKYLQEVDPAILAANGYNIIIGFASSWQGAYFQGAVGSQMWIDNVTVTCE